VYWAAALKTEKDKRRNKNKRIRQNQLNSDLQAGHGFSAQDKKYGQHLRANTRNTCFWQILANQRAARIVSLPNFAPQITYG
jgi:hypothetical protein